MHLWQIILNISCTLNVKNDFAEPHPLILTRKFTSYRYILPDDKDGNINLEKDNNIFLICPNSTLLSNRRELEILNTTCVKNDMVSSRKHKNKDPKFNKLKCEEYFQPTALQTNRTCAGKYKEVVIDVGVWNTRLNVLTFCFDSDLQRTLYVKYDLSSKIFGGQTTARRPGWVQGNLFSLGKSTLNKLYKRQKHKQTINSILGLDKYSSKYVKGGNVTTLYLAKGHLSPKADHIYTALQFLTFHYVNSAPQWMSFNSGNWLVLEKTCRDFASKNGIDLVIYTGTYGISTLPDTNGVQQELYLYVDENNNKAVPIPKVFWKVLYDPKNKAGLAFIGVNNPYYFDPKTDIICRDVCSEIRWIKWNATNVRKGYSYCCAVEDFRKTVKTLPSFTVEKLLL